MPDVIVEAIQPVNVVSNPIAAQVAYIEQVPPIELMAYQALTLGTLLDVYDEVPSGLINGSNATYTSAFLFIPETLRVHVNGIRLKPGDEYVSTGMNTITMSVSPEVNDIILIDYKKH